MSQRWKGNCGSPWEYSHQRVGTMCFSGDSGCLRWQWSEPQSGLRVSEVTVGWASVWTQGVWGDSGVSLSLDSGREGSCGRPTLSVHSSIPVCTSQILAVESMLPVATTVLWGLNDRHTYKYRSVSHDIVTWLMYTVTAALWSTSSWAGFINWYGNVFLVWFATWNLNI